MVIHVGDCREVLREMADGSVQTCVTSPPYFGLRDYGTASWEGGDSACDHAPPRQPRADRPAGGLTGSKTYVAAQEPAYRDVCGKCGATRVDRQIGLESSLDAYVAELVAVFREVRRMLADDGTLWLNLGDSYASGGMSGPHTGLAKAAERSDGKHRNKSGARAAYTDLIRRDIPQGTKPKDLLGVPWRVAFALQADGWYLRSDIIWAKPNPMPESVRDRPTKAHEYLFLLTKSPRYFYDAEAIKEPCTPETVRTGRYRLSLDGVKGVDASRGDAATLDRFAPEGGRNKRTVWTITPKPFKGAHFAVMPPALVEPCILAGSRPGDLVLDPFAGAGTVGVVALTHGRRFVGVELNPAYAQMATERIARAVPTILQPALPLQGAAD